MNRKKILWVVLGAVVFVTVLILGLWWGINIVERNNQLVKSNEMAVLQATFVQQYGVDATIQQLVSPDKVYAVMWTDSDGINHVSWNIGGVWAIVWSSPVPISAP